MILPCAFLLLSSAAAADAPPPIDIPYEKYRLDNGLEVLLHEDHRVPIVAVDVWVHVGSGDEVVGKSGFAHLFEHMMFQGAKHIGEDVHFDVLKQAGASSVNGTTNSDRTNYYEVVPSNQLEVALWLESDRLGFLLDLLNDKSLGNQRDVVRNERRQRYDNVPYGKERFAVAQGLYPEGHPYRYLTIGRHEDIEGAKLDDVRAFFTTWYSVQNATIAISGDVDKTQVKALVAKWFGGLQGAARPRHTTPKLAPLDKTSRSELRDPFAKLVRIKYAWPSAVRFSDDDLDLSIAGDALGKPGWGRLYRALVVEQELAKDVAAFQSGMGYAGQFEVSVTLKPGVDVAVAEAALKRELRRFLYDGPTDAEVRRSVVNTEAQMLFSVDELLQRTDMLQSFNHYLGDPGALPKVLARLKARTPSTVHAAAQRFLAKPRVEIITVPDSAAPASAPAPAPAAAKGGAQ